MKQSNEDGHRGNVLLWVIQVVLALFLLSGAVIKWLPLAQVVPMMPWTGQVPVWVLRGLGFVDLCGALGLILPGLLGIRPELAVWAAWGALLLMLSAAVFHILRGEASVIGVNLAAAVLAMIVALGRARSKGSQQSVRT